MPTVEHDVLAELFRNQPALSAMTHGSAQNGGLEAVLATIVALTRFDEERARFYLDLILAKPNNQVRRALEAMRMQK